MKLLQWGEPERPWRLKCPSHVLWLDALATVFPDARFVMTHRDIAEVIPSVAAVMSALSAPLTEHPDPAFLGRYNTAVWDIALRRLLAFRDAGNDHRFFDISFTEMRRDPMATIRRLYDWLGEDLNDEGARRMTQWWSENSQDRHGAQHHRAEDYGIDAAELRERFAFYNERFDVGASKS